MASSRSCRSSSANSSFSGRVELTRSDRTWVLAGNNSQTPGNKCGGAYGKSVKASTWRGAEDPEVAVVQRGDSCNPEAFTKSDERSVCTTET